MIHCCKNLAAVLAVGLLASLGTNANATSSLDLQDACEVAIKAELSEGNSRMNRVRIASGEQSTSIWMTIRHKAATEPKSTRYRALCTINSAGGDAIVDISEGWWKKGRRGQSPVAVD